MKITKKAWAIIRTEPYKEFVKDNSGEIFVYSVKKQADKMLKFVKKHIEDGELERVEIKTLKEL